MSTKEFPRNALVPVDGSELSLLAAQTAADLAKVAGMSATIVYVIRSMQEYYRMKTAADALKYGVPQSMVKKILEQGEQDAKKIVKKVKHLFEAKGVRVSAKTTRAINPADSILELSEKEYDLIILGAHGQETKAPNTLGSTAKKVVRHSTTSTLIIKKACSFSNILVGVDGSSDSIEALSSAIQLANQFGSNITLLNVQEPRLFAFSHKAAGELGDQILTHARNTIKGDKLKINQLLEFGDPPDCITRLAQQRNHDLIVLGKRGIGTAKRFLLGSVSEKVSHRATCSVLTVPIKC